MTVGIDRKAAVIQRRSLLITDPARDDLDGIYDYIAAGSPESAERFINQLIVSLHRIARLGIEGVARDEIRPGLRMHPLGNYCAYFRITTENLVLIRIVNGSRDIQAAHETTEE